MTSYVIIDIRPLLGWAKRKGLSPESAVWVSARYLSKRYCLPTGFDRKLPVPVNTIPEEYLIPYLEGNIDSLIQAPDADSVLWVELEDDSLVISR